MSILAKDLDTLFSVYLPKENPQLEIRDEQIALAKDIEKVFEQGGIYIAEAGTGIGKSFAYLIPCIKQALQNQQVVIVTATIALQHQLVDKDIPALQKMLGTNIPTMALKGKNNYLCKSRFEKLTQDEDGKIFSNEGLDKTKLENLKEWVSDTATGDREELNALLSKSYSVSHSLWSKMSTNEYMCGGRKCAAQTKARGGKCCFYKEARKQASQSGIIITNYSLLSYHIKNLETQEGEPLLPENTLFVLDEAHNLMENMRQSLTENLTMYDIEQCYDLLFGRQGEVSLEIQLRGAFKKNIQQYIDKIKEKMKDIRARVKKTSNLLFDSRKNIQYMQNAQEINFEYFLFNNSSNAEIILEDARLLLIDFRTLATVLNDAIKLFDPQSESQSDSQFGPQTDLMKALGRCQQWAEQKSNVIEKFTQPKKEENIVRWCKFGHETVEFCTSPLFINNFLHDTFFAKTSAVVCTSATMRYNRDFSYWINRNGIPNAHTTAVFESPFPYETNVLLAVPSDAPLPTDEANYVDYLLQALPECLDISEGSALILCTSKKMVLALSEGLRQRAKSSAWNLLTQDGSTTPASLANKFREDKHSVLVATASFWEGFDAPGDTLRLLVITRLPFPSPSSLYNEEESKHCKAQGGNDFFEVSLPVAELKLRQGFGRLMRSKNDGGVVLITDNRFYIKKYGTQLQASLPKCSMNMDTIKNITREMHAFFEGHLK